MSVFQGKYFAYINSTNRTSGDDGNFTFNVQVPQDRKFNRVVVLDAIIPKSYYLVTTDIGYFTLSEPNAADVIITIPPGCYILNAWVATIQRLLTNNSQHGYTYTITSPVTNSQTDANTGKFIYTVTGTPGNPLTALNQPSITVNSELHEPFGFHPSSTNTFTLVTPIVGNGSGTLTSTHVVKLQAEDRLLITSNICVGSGGSDIGILQAINAQASPDYSTIVYVNPQVDANAKVYASTGGTNYSFALTDEHGHPIDLNGLNWNMTIMLYYENDIYEKIKNFLRLMVMDLEHKQTLTEEEQQDANLEIPQNQRIPQLPPSQVQKMSSQEFPQTQEESGAMGDYPPEEPQMNEGGDQEVDNPPNEDLNLEQDNLPKDQNDNIPTEEIQGEEIQGEENQEKDLHLKQDDFPKDKDDNLRF